MPQAVVRQGGWHARRAGGYPLVPSHIFKVFGNVLLNTECWVFEVMISVEIIH